MPATKKRRLLALYVDFLFFSTLLTPLGWLLERLGGPEITMPVALVAFAAIRVGVTRYLRMSPGRWCLGIGPEPAAIVEPRILEREAWWTMVAGVLLILEGSKNLVRWTQGFLPPPLLGNDMPADLSVGVICLLGLVNLWAGVRVLRTEWVPAAIAAGIVGFEALGAFVNQEAFREWGASAVTTRRALQGVNLRPGEVEFGQTFAATYVPTVLAIGAAFLLVVGWRFRGDRTA